MSDPYMMKFGKTEARRHTIQASLSGFVHTFAKYKIEEGVEYSRTGHFVASSKLLVGLSQFDAQAQIKECPVSLMLYDVASDCDVNVLYDDKQNSITIELCMSPEFVSKLEDLYIKCPDNMILLTFIAPTALTVDQSGAERSVLMFEPGKSHLGESSTLFEKLLISNSTAIENYPAFSAKSAQP